MISDISMPVDQRSLVVGISRKGAMVVLLALYASVCSVHAQSFDSGSDGSDGALNLTSSGTVDFDPVALGLDADGDGVFNFTTITIGTETTVRLSANRINHPVIWLASGDVQVDGVIDLNGQPGQSGDDVVNESRFPAVPGAGGYSGGLGATAIAGRTVGNGPGGGGFSFQSNNLLGSGAGHATAGNAPYNLGNGLEYGNNFLMPLVGGSGGGGGGYLSFQGNNGGGGGAGGGAVLIASSSSISVAGSILADGAIGGLGQNARSNVGGGGGSGGAIQLVAGTVTITGTLSAIGGDYTWHSSSWGNNRGSVGRIRIEGFQRTITGSIAPPPVATAPTALFIQPPSMVRVTSVAGVPVPINPTGSFTMPDVAIDENAEVSVEIEARNIPLDTIVQLHLFSDDGADQVVDSTSLAGTEELSTATVNVTIPSGFSRGFARATWEP